jgi:diacylglycerol kinase (ATP)
MTRRIASFRYALAGIAHLVRSQPNARIHLAIAAAVVWLGLWLGLTARDWAVIALTIGLVFAAEGFNTAIEALVDLASPDPHPLAKTAKDVAAGAVLLAALAAVAVGLLILGPPLWDWLP